MCGVGSPPTDESRSEHGQRELVKVVHSRYSANHLGNLSPRWKGFAKLARWKQKQILIMLSTIWSVRALTVWEQELFMELLRIRKSQDCEVAVLFTILEKIAPSCKENFKQYRERVRTQLSLEANLFLGSYMESARGPLRSSHPGRMAAMAKSYSFLCKWIVKSDLPATQFHRVEKRRKRGYTDHGSLGSRSYATKKLDEELAQQHYDNWPPWRKSLALLGHEEFLRWCYTMSLI
jgi:hypothetical protein